jgi:uncharacterized protein YyaL (SSP411 family)
LSGVPTYAEPEHVTAFARHAVAWVEGAISHWNCGGVAARYHLQTTQYQGPYPETTGYSIPTLLRMAERFGEPSIADRAWQAGTWLAGRQRTDGAIRCNVEPVGASDASDKVILFDCAAILQGFCALGRAGDERFVQATARLARFLQSCQHADGTWRDHLYFETFGSHNTLVGYALIEASQVTGERAFEEAGHRCLDIVSERITERGFIDGCEFGGDPSLMFLHPYAYTLEGFVKAGTVAGDDRLLETAERTLGAMVTRTQAKGTLPASHLRADLSDATDYTVSTGLAQIADLLFKMGRLRNRPDFLDLAGKIMNVLRSWMDVDHNDPGIHGGITASYPASGGYGPHTINNWTMKYFLDASDEELVVLESRRG